MQFYIANRNLKISIPAISLLQEHKNSTLKLIQYISMQNLNTVPPSKTLHDNVHCQKYFNKMTDKYQTAKFGEKTFFDNFSYLPTFLSSL